MLFISDYIQDIYEREGFGTVTQRRHCYHHHHGLPSSRHESADDGGEGGGSSSGYGAGAGMRCDIDGISSSLISNEKFIPIEV